MHLIKASPIVFPKRSTLRPPSRTARIAPGNSVPMPSSFPCPFFPPSLPRLYSNVATDSDVMRPLFTPRLDFWGLKCHSFCGAAAVTGSCQARTPFEPNCCEEPLTLYAALARSLALCGNLGNIGVGGAIYEVS